MSYNLTMLQAVDTVGELVSYANFHTLDLFSTGCLLAFFLILLARLKRYSFEDTLAVSSFWTFLLSVVGLIAGLVNPLVTLFFGAMMSFSAMMLFFPKKG